MCAVTHLFIALLPNHGTYSFLCFHLKAFNSRIAYCFVEFNLCWWFFVRILFFPQESSGEKKEYLFKVLVIGDLGVGKTSIIKRYVHQFFSVHYRATISFARFKSTGKFAEHILFNHSPTYVRHLQDTSYWCDTLTYVMKVTIVISDERYGFVCLLFKFYTENVSVYLLFLFVFVSVFWHCEILSIALFLVYIFLNFTYIGVDFALKVINWDPDTLIRLQLWDIAGNMYCIADNILYLMSRKRCWLTRTNMFLSTRIYNLFHANSGCIPWGWSG